MTFKLLREADFAQARTRDSSGARFPPDDGRSLPITLESFLNHGTMNRAGVWSPCTGRPGVIALTKKEDLPRQGQQGLARSPNDCGRFRRPKDLLDKGLSRSVIVSRRAVNRGLRLLRLKSLEEVFQRNSARKAEGAYARKAVEGRSPCILAAPLRDARHGDDLFTPRQLLALGTFARHSREAAAILRTNDTGFAEAVEGIWLATLNSDR